MIPVAAKIRFLVSGYMDFSQRRSRSWRGLGWSRRARLDLGLGRAGGDGGGRRKPVRGGLAAASMPRTPPSSPPARPLTHSSGSARHGKKKEEQMQKRHCGWLPGWTSPYPTSIRHISSTQGVDLPRRPRSTPTGNRDLPTVIGKLSKAGRCRMAGCPRHGCRGQAPRDGFTAPPPSDTPLPPHGTSQSRFGFGFGLGGCRVQPRKETGRLSAASLLFTSA